MSNFFHYLEILYFSDGEYRVSLTLSLYPLETGFIKDYIFRIFITKQHFEKLDYVLNEHFRRSYEKRS